MKMVLPKKIIEQILIDHIEQNYDVKVRMSNLFAFDSHGDLGDHIKIAFEAFGEKEIASQSLGDKHEIPQV